MPAGATPPAAPVMSPAQFPEPEILKPAVHFWRQVFARYSENQSLVHSTVDPGKVITVLDFSGEAARLSPAALDVLRARREKAALKSAESSLDDIVTAAADPAQMDAAARRLYRLYGGGDVARYKALQGTLRVQRGLRERTAHALEVAGRYLPQMERIFSGYGLPRVLTRLPLVESSFNLDAYSKVGAAGIWQFIPASARIYMTLDAVQDDRRDPWTSTDAAARHLKDDYDALGQWPLAVTAYNYGRAGIARALQEVHGSTLTDLLQRYDNPRFGFASRNFYAEFLAAVQIAADAPHYFGRLQRDAPIRFDTVTTHDYLPYATLVAMSGADADTFRRLNPSFDPAVLQGRLYVPPDTTIRVPHGQASHFDALYAALGAGERYRRQRVWYVAYTVHRGDVLGRIAAQHHVSVAALLRYNSLRSARLIRVGQTLRIPTGGSASAPAPHLIAAVAHPVRTQVAAPRRALIVHRVLAGQTLSGIAARYQASIASIRRLNGLRDADFLRVGMRLKIPRAE